jgi:hypothetical protein
VENENDLRCAIGTPGYMAQVNAQAKAQVNAQVILPAAQVILPSGASHLPWAQVILP